MSLIASILPRANVVAEFNASGKKRVFEEAALLFEAQQGFSRDLVFEKLFARERLGSTGLGHGVAIPHCRIEGLLNEATAAFIRLTAPIPFDAFDDEPVKLIFVLLVPHDANDTHLHILAELAQMFDTPAFRRQLLAAVDADALYTLLTSWQTGTESNTHIG
ncbi:MAG: PTS IIA-like nitrogen regulatory protein PtsN [Azoarcus sp.]|jgi:PTS system nitrogen regulatory IIA component|nr:PTS IIA-like nitrogen regulatory protein PtsN [Azoarcus sp.]